MFSCGFGELSHLDMIIIIAPRHCFTSLVLVSEAGRACCLRFPRSGALLSVSGGFYCFWFLTHKKISLQDHAGRVGLGSIS